MKGRRYFSTWKYGASGGDGDHDNNHNYNNFPFTLACISAEFDVVFFNNVKLTYITNKFKTA